MFAPILSHQTMLVRDYPGAPPPPPAPPAPPDPPIPPVAEPIAFSAVTRASLFGVTGAFLAVPVAATTAVLLRYVNEQIDDGVDPEAPPEDSHAAALLAEGKVADDVG